MDKTIEIAKEIVKHNQVKRNGSMFNVSEHLVRVVKKRGRKFLTCDCWNHSIFPNEGFCLHKTAVIIYLSDNNFMSKINKIIEDYQKYKKLKLPVSIDCMINDLGSLKRTK